MDITKQFINSARLHLRGILGSSGEVLYSAASTLRPGEVYLIGHNPGGDVDDPHLKTVGSSLDELPTKTLNSYLDTSWNRRAIARAPLQRRVIWLLDQLGLDPRTVAASNLIFPRSRDAAGSQFRQLSTKCWPVHEMVLRIVQPQLVVAYGNSNQSPYKFLFHQFGATQDERHPSGHGTWVCRSFVVPGRPRVVGLPHLSRYDISAHSDVVKWIRRLSRPSFQQPG